MDHAVGEEACWMYLPHLDDKSDAERNERAKRRRTAAEQERLGEKCTDAEEMGEHRMPRRSVGDGHAEATMRAAGDAAARAGVGATRQTRQWEESQIPSQHGALVDPDKPLQGIRGRGQPPGPARASQATTASGSGEHRLAQIRGPVNGPGTRDARTRQREQERLEARNSHLQQSLADHAERVRKRRSESQPAEGTPSAKERLEAIRRRLAERRHVNAANEQQGDFGGGADAEPAMHEGRMRGEQAPHHTVSSGDVGQRQQLAARGPAAAAPANADAAAAASRAAWHTADETHAQ